MVRLVRWFCCLLVFVPAFGFGQAGSSPRDVVKGLKGKIIFLRGRELENNLHFDASGKELNDYTAWTFAFSALKVREISIADDEVQIAGEREVLAYDRAPKPLSLDHLLPIPTKNSITIAIALEPNHPEDFQPAFHAVFALSPQDALNDMTAEEQQAVLDNIGSTAPPDQGVEPNSYTPGTPQLYKPGGPVAPPHLTYSVDPVWSAKARRHKTQGSTVLRLIVDEHGRPTHIRVQTSLTSELDLSAVAAVSQYRFAPATLNGKPVSTLINVEMHFRIW